MRTPINLCSESVDEVEAIPKPFLEPRSSRQVPTKRIFGPTNFPGQLCGSPEDESAEAENAAGKNLATCGGMKTLDYSPAYRGNRSLASTSIFPKL